MNPVLKKWLEHFALTLGLAVVSAVLSVLVVMLPGLHVPPQYAALASTLVPLAVSALRSAKATVDRDLAQSESQSS